MKNPNQVKVLVSYLSNYIRMDEKEIEYLDNILIQRKYKKKEIIHQQGDVQRYVAFVVEGAIRFYYTDEKGVEYTIDFAFENTPIGSYKGLIQSTNTPAFAETIEDTLLIGIYRDDFLAFLQQFPRYYAVITEVLGNALIDMNLRDKLLRIPSSRERYQELGKLKPNIIKRIPLTHIASYLKMALGTLSRVRAGKL